MAKVDILLTFWGDVALLKKAVESVLAQTEPNWRLLVFDDCYPSDEPAAYFKTIKDPRVVYYRHKKNLGVTHNFQYALQAATAPYCVEMGCDDVMLPNYLEVALKNINNADFYQPGVEVIDENGAIYLPIADKVKRLLQPRQSGVYSGEKLATSLCHGNWLYFPSIMWKTEVAQRYGFNTKYKITQDVDLEFNIIKDGGKLSFDKTITFQYRRSSKSLSSKEKKKGGIRFNEESDVYNHFTKAFQELGWKKASRAAKLRITSRLHKAIS